MDINKQIDATKKSYRLFAKSKRAALLHKDMSAMAKAGKYPDGLWG